MPGRRGDAQDAAKGSSSGRSPPWLPWVLDGNGEMGGKYGPQVVANCLAGQAILGLLNFDQPNDLATFWKWLFQKFGFVEGVKD